MSTGAIGGYFELELPRTGTSVHPGAYRFQSARVAFLALLRSARPARVWMPLYLCDTMYAPLREAGVVCMPYSIDARFDIATEIVLHEKDWIYYVNYFGLRDSYVDSLLERFGPKHVVVDNCQAFFSSPRDCIATIYSPRKFFGVPDGGLLLTTLPIEMPTQRDMDSLRRASYLLERLASTPEAGYASYKLAEDSLEQAMEPRRMSQLTESLLATMDLDRARRQRSENFAVLHTRLGELNGCVFEEGVTNGPLCYPLLVEAPGLREHLIASRIFVATYWPDVLKRVNERTIEAKLTKNLLPLPCDQRYVQEDMERIVETCVSFLSNRSSNQ
ncbi:hypothetical protein [uncultured Massilia sp.]|uniref:hypothetical protein n=1 Tax=uncultured Massilia sp. TaxID=169973 RepID=UPI0025D401D0|nr:hypothetical protein [uncultured Massilia sp.]